MRLTGPLESAALLTVLPMPAAAARSTRGVLPWAPLVGLVLGGAAAGAGWLGARYVSPAAGGVLALVVLAVLTRGLHLDGLADTADGLGPLRSPERALQVMHRGDVGPFGVAALVLTLLLQAAGAAALLGRPGGWLGVWTAVVTARVALARAGLPGVRTAEGSALGRAVAGTVSPAWLSGWLLVTAGGAAAAGAALDGRVLAIAAPAGLAAGLLAAELLLRRAARRLGGVTGDVMGAMAEVATTVALLVAAALW
jgi:adenosylcobinamide-GDP ribazoletransferase